MSTVSIFWVEDSAVIKNSLSAVLEDLVPVKVSGFAEAHDQACCQVLAIVGISLKDGLGLDVLRAFSPGSLSSAPPCSPTAPHPPLGPSAGCWIPPMCSINCVKLTS